MPQLLSLARQHRQHEFQDGRSMPLPLMQYDASCPVLLLINRRTPVNQGFGARASFLMWAADAALKIGAVVAVDESFWNGGGMHAYHYSLDFNWARQVLPFPNFTAAKAHAPAGMVDSSRHLIGIDALLKSWQCGHIYRVQAGQYFSCGVAVRWCHELLAGALDRTLSIVSAMPSPHLRDLFDRNPPNGSSPALAIWHIRTGDITLPLRRSAATSLKQTIDAAFKRRGVRHVALTFDRASLQSAFPWLRELGIREVLDSRNLNDAKAFVMQLHSEVLVSTGSSFPLIPAGLAPPGRQIHFFFPPKNVVELRDDGICCIPNTCSCEAPLKGITHIRSRLVALNCSVNSTLHTFLGGHVGPLRAKEQADKFSFDVRTHEGWKSNFVRKNTIPVACDGEIFPEYRYKLEKMVTGLDSLSAIAPQKFAWLAYEGWMR